MPASTRYVGVLSSTSAKLVIAITFEAVSESAEQTACSVNSGEPFRPDCTLGKVDTIGRVQASPVRTRLAFALHLIRNPPERFVFRSVSVSVISPFQMISLTQTKHQSTVAELRLYYLGGGRQL